MKERYFGDWSGVEDLLRDWSHANVTDGEVLLACCGGECYDGSAFVIFERDGKLYEAHESHCSCYGLDDWTPEETTVAALKIRPPEFYGVYDKGRATLAWAEMIAALEARIGRESKA